MGVVMLPLSWTDLYHQSEQIHRDLQRISEIGWETKLRLRHLANGGGGGEVASHAVEQLRQLVLECSTAVTSLELSVMELAGQQIMPLHEGDGHAL